MYCQHKLVYMVLLQQVYITSWQICAVYIGSLPKPTTVLYSSSFSVSRTPAINIAETLSFYQSYKGLPTIEGIYPELESHHDV